MLFFLVAIEKLLLLWSSRFHKVKFQDIIVMEFKFHDCLEIDLHYRDYNFYDKDGARKRPRRKLCGVTSVV